MNGPHCPKCGFCNGWADYANGDALRCEVFTVNTTTGTTGPCGYIHWLKNAPADETKANQLNDEARGILSLNQRAEKRKRVRALVHLLIACPDYRVFDDENGARFEEWKKNVAESPELFDQRFNDRVSVVDVAITLDERIEKIT